MKCLIRRSDISISEVAPVKFDNSITYHINYDSVPYTTYLAKQDEQKMIDCFLSWIERFEKEKEIHVKGKDRKEEQIKYNNMEEKLRSHIKYLENLLNSNNIPYDKFNFP